MRICVLNIFGMMLDLLQRLQYLHHPRDNVGLNYVNFVYHLRDDLELLKG